jgi:2'-5' RNA ligase
MSNNLVIVAIPEENDRVWKISSEKVPHLTLLFLGDQANVSNLDKIVQFVEHAATTSLRRFWLPVDRRGELGNDPETGPADVLFFRTRGYDLKAVADFRAQLLQDNNIKSAYDAAPQFEGPWVPHLTLGYQGTPAKPDNSDYPGFYEVNFDRIAVWTGNSEGPEFLLQDRWDDIEFDMSVAPLSMSDLAARGAAFLGHASVLDSATNREKIKAKVQSVLDDVTGDADQDLGSDPDGVIRDKLKKLLDDFTGDKDRDLVQSAIGEALIERFGIDGLQHHGVKGMKWGVRKDRAAGAAKTVGRAAGKAGLAVAKGADNASFHLVKNHDATHTAITRGAADKFHTHDVPALKAKHGSSAKVLTRMKDPRSAESKAYRKDAKDAWLNRLEESANSITNVQGNRHYTLKESGKPNTKQYFWHVSVEKIQHAAANTTLDWTVHPVFDENGFITSLEIVDNPDTLAQTADLGAEFLAHYGVKGMHWGVRKSSRSEPPAAVPAHAMSHVPSRTGAKTKIEVKGGENHPAHPDAIKVAEARAKLSKSGTAALSNQELRDVANRLQLESQVKQMHASGGKKFVTSLLKTQGQQELNARFNVNRQGRLSKQR